MKKPKWKTWEPSDEQAPLSPVPGDMRPALFAKARVASGAIDLGFRKLELDGDAAAVTDAIDGRRTITELAQICGIAGERAAQVVQELFEHGVVREAGTASLPGRTFHVHIQNVIRRADWARNRGGLFEELAARPTRRLVMDYLLQTFHWTNSAASHISAAIHHAPNERLQMILVDFLGDEYWHGQWMRRGLRAGGLMDRDIDASIPLPAIVAHIGLATLAATHSTLAYAAILTGTEGVPAEKTGALETVWDALQKANVVDAEAIMPFRHHSLSDEAYGHDRVGPEIFASFRELDRVQQDTVYRWLFMYLNNRNEINAAILRNYQLGDASTHFASIE